MLAGNGFGQCLGNLGQGPAGTVVVVLFAGEMGSDCKEVRTDRPTLQRGPYGPTLLFGRT